jgi:SAM-dependent methyltransferase
MRRLYQQEWHAIPFRSFATLSSTKLADSAFYSAFYKAFFERYKSPAELEPGWLEVKQQTLDFIVSRPAVTRDSRILSLGCGLGLIEEKLLDLGYKHVDINEVSREPLRWVLGRFDPDRVHVGFFPDCVPPDRTYDVILLVGIDGVFDQPELISFLHDVRARLRPGGHCILVSWTQHVGRTRLQASVDVAKDAAKLLLDRVGIRPLGQFWGYIRSAPEIHQAIHAAGFAELQDGMLEERTRFPTYWLTVRKA